MKNTLITFLILLTVKLSASCVPAFPKKVKVINHSNESVELFLKGDEHNKYAVSMDGYLLVPKKESWYYLKKDINLGYAISDVEIGSSIKTIGKQELVVCSDSIISGFSKKNGLLRAKKQNELSGTSHALVILIEFKDKKFVKSKQEIDNLFNEIGYHTDGAQGSVRDFYRYASYGKFDLISDVYGPYKTNYSMDFYGGNEATGSDSNPLEIALEAIRSLPKDIDLSLYDNNDDGVVDNVHIVFAGYGEESGAPSSAVWSHEYPHSLPITKNGYGFAGYSCTPELRSNMGNGISRIGVICHELGHAFGANDYYDVDYQSNGSFSGTGVWDVMGSGSWNNNGISPSNFNPYVKAFDFGWVSPTVPKENGSYTLLTYNHNPDVLKIPTNNPDDYYLVEYRQKQSFDKGLPGEGVLIYHVHPQIESMKLTNTINNKHPQGLYPVCASSMTSPFISSDYGEIDSAGCPFPGITNKTQFSTTSVPNVFQWSGDIHQFCMDNITLNSDYASIDIYWGEHQPSDSINNSLIYHENFENGLKNLFVESIEGKTEWSIYPTKLLSNLHDMPTPYGEKHALMIYNGTKSSAFSKSTITSENIELATEGIYTFSFWIRTIESPLAGSQKFELLIKDENSSKWEKIFENVDPINDWRKIQVEVPHGISNLNYKLSGEILNCGIFIDDISIEKKYSLRNFELESNNAHLTLKYNPFCIVSNGYIKVVICDLSGKVLLTCDMSPEDIIYPILEKGMYFISTDRGDKYKIIL